MGRRSRLALALACLMPLAAAAEPGELRELRARVGQLELEVAELRLALERIEERLAEESPAGSARPSSPLWADARRWQALRRGMSRFEVMQVLGEPGKVSPYYGHERWEYPHALGGRVLFDARGRVSQWKAPGPELSR